MSFRLGNIDVEFQCYLVASGISDFLKYFKFPFGNIYAVGQIAITKYLLPLPGEGLCCPTLLMLGLVNKI